MAQPAPPELVRVLGDGDLGHVPVHLDRELAPVGVELLHLGGFGDHQVGLPAPGQRREEGPHQEDRMPSSMSGSHRL